MLSKQQLTFLRSLHQKKYRQMYGKFLVEGDKPVRELLTSAFKVDAIYRTPDWDGAYAAEKITVLDITEAELGKISTHENPNRVVAVAHMPDTAFAPQPLAKALYIALDHISDPGNAGTIIRIADWFGIEQVFFSENSVDIFNPKVVGSAKGSLFRVKCGYTDLKELMRLNPHLKTYGAFMHGENIYKTKLAAEGMIIIGNEANGISKELLPFISEKISIPALGKAESLNAAVAAGIIVSEFRRNG